MHITNIINTRVFDCLFIATIINITVSINTTVFTNFISTKVGIGGEALDSIRLVTNNVLASTNATRTNLNRFNVLAYD